MTLWNEHSGRIPPPSTYPVLFAIRDFFIAGLETAKATERPVTETWVWPTHAQLVEFINQNKTRYAYLTEISRGKLHDALERLKSTGFIKENLENWTYIISDAGPERTKRLQSLVLFDVSAGTTVTGGGDAHRNITFNFLQDFVRQKAYLPKYPEQTEPRPDGILIPPKTGGADAWNFDKQTAVECEIDADRHWDRVLSNIQRDFNMNYHSIIIVTNTKGGKASVEEHLRNTDAIPEQWKQKIQVVLFELRVPLFRR